MKLAEQRRWHIEQSTWHDAIAKGTAMKDGYIAAESRAQAVERRRWHIKQSTWHDTVATRIAKILGEKTK